MDYRDTGDSDSVSEPYTIADLADDGAFFLSALEVQRAHVVGISLGGSVALQMVLRHPERVEKLVLVSASATYIPPSIALMAQMEHLQHNPALSPANACRAFWLWSALQATLKAIQKIATGLPNGPSIVL